MAGQSFDTIFNTVAKMYEDDVKAEIRATMISSIGGETSPNHRDVIEAFEEYYRARPGQTVPIPPFYERHIFLIVAFMLTLAFGGFGLAINSRQGASDRVATGFLDIAKICAGAVVGGAAGSGLAGSVGRSRSRRGRSNPSPEAS